MRSILLVDENQDFRESLAELLSDNDFRVHQADSAFNAIDVISENETTLDSLIVNYELPEIDGSELIRAVFEIGLEFKKIVLLISNQIEDRVLREMQRRDVSVMLKPFDIRTLLSLINN